MRDLVLPPEGGFTPRELAGYDVHAGDGALSPQRNGVLKGRHVIPLDKSRVRRPLLPPQQKAHEESKEFPKGLKLRLADNGREKRCFGGAPRVAEKLCWLPADEQDPSSSPWRCVKLDCSLP
jgi:hypothetical protein